MSKPAERVLGRDEVQSKGNSLLKRFARASSLSAQHGFQFGERFLNRREIRRIGGQKQQATATRFNGRFDPRSQMDREIVQDHDLSGAQAGGKDLLDVDRKGGAISGSIQEKCRSHAIKRHRGNQGHAGAIIARHLADRALPSRGIRVQGSHSDVRTGLGDLDQILTGQVRGLFAPGGPLGFLLLACSQGLFFRVQPRACLARVMLAGLTLMPCVASHN
jgi:hypothetical protein